MAIRKILVYGDEKLRQPSRQVLKVSAKIKTLVKDLKDTMYSANGVGLAAPQVGEDLRVFVIDVADEDQPPNPIIFINPVIISKSGACNSYEGCLSFPDAYTDVRRYANVKVKALDINGRPFLMEATGGTLFARAIQHEFDHLNGVLFVDHARDVDEANKELSDKNLNLVEPEKLVSEPDLEASLSQLESVE